MPVISILLPYKNAAETLSECVESILNQNFTDFEVLAINDHSDDSSQQIIQTLSDTRFRLMDNPGKGLVDTLNFGIQESSTPLIARMDADDIMQPDRLLKQYQFMSENTNISVLGSQVALFPEEIIQSGYKEYIRWQNTLIDHSSITNNIYVEAPFAHPSVMLRKHVLLEIGAYRKGKFPEDYDLWLRLFHQGYKMAKLPEVLLWWRESENRLSRTSHCYQRDAFSKLRAEYLAKDSRLKNNRPLFIWGAGRKTRKRVQYLLELGIKVSGWVDIDPKKIGLVFQGAKVYTSTQLRTVTPRPFILNYVTNHGARDLIKCELENLGFIEGDDFLAVG